MVNAKAVFGLNDLPRTSHRCNAVEDARSMPASATPAS